MENHGERQHPLANRQQHPLEMLYQARDELDRAAASQQQVDLTKQDLPSYGRILQAIISSLGELTGTLAHQVQEIDRERLYQRALQDHPYEVIDSAVEYLGYLRRSLAAAIDTAEGYRERSENVHENVRDEPRGEPGQ